MEVLLLWSFYILTFYAFIPGVISRLFGFRVFNKGRSERDLALTFDDGPHPEYTAQLLDLLKSYNAKATFFVLGIQAERYPELLKRMHDEGHVIGIHNYVHKTNWFMRPKTVKQHIQKTSDIIESITGKRPIYYRPPWGIVNLFDFNNLGHIQIILWSAMFNDWRKKVGAERLYKRMSKKCRGGEVLLLHDCGLTFGADAVAPANMLIALERFIQDAQEKGLRCVRIDELIRATDEDKVRNPSWFKRFVVRVWLGYERIFHLVFGMKTTNPEKPVFHFRLRPYQGKPIEMDDGTVLNRDDKVLEIHFDNRRLYDIGTRSRNMMQVAIHMIRDVERTLPELAEYVQSKPEVNAEFKALYGVSMINRGPEQFGFIVKDLPRGMFSWASRHYLKLIMRIIHPSGRRRIRNHSEHLVPKLIVMSKHTLLTRYGKSYAYEANTQDQSVLRSDHVVNKTPSATS